ncbi:MAG: hypothetical protein WAV20_12015 [Blastocatellia bacterium]
MDFVKYAGLVLAAIFSPLVMMVSNGVRIITRELALLKEAALKQNASCGYALFEGRDDIRCQNEKRGVGICEEDIAR